jgi:hypothetical protein
MIINDIRTKLGCDGKALKLIILHHFSYIFNIGYHFNNLDSTPAALNLYAICQDKK